MADETPKIRIREFKEGEVIPPEMVDAFNREAPYEALIPGVTNPRITQENLDYFESHIRPATIKLGLFTVNRRGKERLVGFATGGLKRIKFPVYKSGAQRTARQWRLFPLTGLYVPPELRKQGVGNRLLLDMIRRGWREGRKGGVETSIEEWYSQVCYLGRSDGLIERRSLLIVG